MTEEENRTSLAVPPPLPPLGKHRGKKVKKTTLIMLAAFFGGIGAHKFHIKKYLQGTLYLLFFWTMIPLLLSLADIFIYARKSEEEIAEDYPLGVSATVITSLSCLGVLVLTILIGIVLAIYIPRYLNISGRTIDASVRLELFKLSRAEHEYHVIHGVFAKSLKDLALEDPPRGITLTIEKADSDCFLATGRHTESAKEFFMDCYGVRNGKAGGF